MKTFFSMLLGLLLFTGVSTGDVSAQAAKSINAGVVNGKATRLPKPDYPQELRDAGIEGIVVVNVVIDETGSVIQAEAEMTDQRARTGIDGATMEIVVLDPQLRASAERAAREAKFAPLLINGEPLKVSGKILYNFIAATAKITPLAEKSSADGVLNSKATSLMLPEYPAAARAVKAGGTVTVQVTIDEEGNVVSVAALSGHPLLRSASEAAAKQARFSPTVVNGQAVKVHGVLVFNFVP